MWWKKPKFKKVDDHLVETIKYGLPGGAHVRDMIPV
jgi:hypothetical protein